MRSVRWRDGAVGRSRASVAVRDRADVRSTARCSSRRSPGATDMLARQLALAGYLALVFWALGVAVVAVSIRWPSVATAAVALLGLMADYVIVKAWDPLSRHERRRPDARGGPSLRPGAARLAGQLRAVRGAASSGDSRRSARTREARRVACVLRHGHWVEVCQGPSGKAGRTCTRTMPENRTAPTRRTSHRRPMHDRRPSVADAACPRRGRRDA